MPSCSRHTVTKYELSIRLLSCSIIPPRPLLTAHLIVGALLIINLDFLVDDDAHQGGNRPFPASSLHSQIRGDVAQRIQEDINTHILFHLRTNNNAEIDPTTRHQTTLCRLQTFDNNAPNITTRTMQISLLSAIMLSMVAIALAGCTTTGSQFGNCNLSSGTLPCSKDSQCATSDDPCKVDPKNSAQALCLFL